MSTPISGLPASVATIADADLLAVVQSGDTYRTSRQRLFETVGHIKLGSTSDVGINRTGAGTLGITNGGAGAGAITTGQWHATAVSEVYGGTNQTSYVTGEILYASNTNTLSKLSGNIAASMKVLTQTGSGVVSAAPTWTTLTHSMLAGLSADDHAQYLLLAGRAGGQIVAGGIAASENLLLTSTAHSTKGYVKIGGTAGDNLWIGGTDGGRTAPACPLHVKHAQTGTSAEKLIARFAGEDVSALTPAVEILTQVTTQYIANSAINFKFWNLGSERIIGSIASGFANTGNPRNDSSLAIYPNLSVQPYSIAGPAQPQPVGGYVLQSTTPATAAVDLFQAKFPATPNAALYAYTARDSTNTLIYTVGNDKTVYLYDSYTDSSNNAGYRLRVASGDFNIEKVENGTGVGTLNNMTLGAKNGFKWSSGGVQIGALVSTGRIGLTKGIFCGDNTAGSGTPYAVLDADFGGLTQRSVGGVNWCSSTSAVGTIDLSLARDAANTLAQRNSTNAQTFRVYNTFTDANNGEWGELVWSSNQLTLQTNFNGTGVNRQLNLSGHWAVFTSAVFGPIADNARDIGQNGSNRPRTLYTGTSVITPLLIARQSGGVAGNDEVQISHDGTDAHIDCMGDGGSLLIGTSATSGSGKVRIQRRDAVGRRIDIDPDSAGNNIQTIDSAALLTLSANAGGSDLYLRGLQNVVVDAAYNRDVGFKRFAANTLQVTNGSTGFGTLAAGSAKIYNTYTDASNGEWYDSCLWSGNLAVVGTNCNGTGTFRTLVVVGNSNTFYTGATRGAAALRWTMDSSGHFWAQVDNTLDIGESATTRRPRNIYVGTSVVLGGTVLTADATNTLAQRNGVNPQVFNLYDTYTDASNYRRLAVRAAAGSLGLFVQSIGTAIGGSLRFECDHGAIIFCANGSTAQWTIDTSGNLAASAGVAMLDTVSATVSAAGTTQGAGTALTSGINVITTATGGVNDAVLLPSPAIGRTVAIANESGATVQVFPTTGVNIDDAAANAAYSLADNGHKQFKCITSTRWLSF